LGAAEGIFITELTGAAMPAARASVNAPTSLLPSFPLGF